MILRKLIKKFLVFFYLISILLVLLIVLVLVDGFLLILKFINIFIFIWNLSDFVFFILWWFLCLMKLNLFILLFKLWRICGGDLILLFKIWSESCFLSLHLLFCKRLIFLLLIDFRIKFIFFLFKTTHFVYISIDRKYV